MYIYTKKFSVLSQNFVKNIQFFNNRTSMKDYKYKINEYLHGLPMKDYKKAMKIIPRLLHISENTFHNYRNIQIGENRDIPYEKVKRLELLFGIKDGMLKNYEIKGQTITELLKSTSLDDC